MLQAVTELWGQFYQGGNSMEKVGWQVPEPCFAWVWDSGLPSWWSPALVWDEHLWLPTSNMVLLMFFPSNSTLCEIQKCYFAVKILAQKAQYPESTANFNFTLMRVQGKTKPMSLLIVLFPKSPRVPSATMARPTRRKASSTASQGFPLNQQHKMHMEKKNIEFWDAVESLTSCWDVKMA